MSTGLQVVGSSPVAPPAQTRRAYLRHATIHPLSFATFVVGLGVSACLGSLAAAMVTLAVGVAMVWVVSGHGGFQRGVDAYLLRQARVERRRLREERMLEAASGHRDQLTALSSQVDDIERTDGRLAQRFDLEELLDLYTQLAVAHERCLRAMRTADRARLARDLADSRTSGATARLRRISFLERRIRHWDQCKARAEQLVEELEAVAEFIRLIAQKAACPDDEGTGIDEDLERRLWDLDEEESALRLLSA